MKKRKEILDKYKWNLSEYATEENFDNIYETATSDLDKIKDFENKLNNKKDILECFKFSEQKAKELEKLIVYARIKIDEDLTVSSAQERYNKIETKENKYEVDSSFISPQLLQNSDEFLLSLAKDTDFKNYNKILLDIIKERKHTLSQKEENLLSEMGAFSGAFKKIFDNFDDGDLKFKKVKNSEGKLLPMNAIVAYKYLISDDRVLRKNAYEELNGAYGRYNNLLVQNYMHSVKKDVAYSKLRKFDSSLQSALFNQNVPKEIYEKLMEGINKNLKVIQRYFAVKAKALKLEKPAVYDLKTILGKKNDTKYSYEEASDIIIKATECLGKEYTDNLKKAFKNRWIDVMPNENKNSGAFSWGAYGLQPIVLMNFDGTFRSVSTLAHELGHSMHSYFSDKNNPYFKAGYEIFCAEVASTVNEVLLAEHMLKKEKDLEKQKFFLDDLINSFNSTVFRQAMFSQFEDEVHKKVENNESISGEIFNNFYYDLNKKFFGKNVELPECVKFEWSRIPHFYRPYYVFAYATGFLSAIVIVKNIEDNAEKGVKDYYKFLSGGCSKSPDQLLKSGGVDLTKQETYDKAFEYLDNLITRLEKLI